ncbi:hypothetical protein L596_006990 [Steinernema carpocapsae]|uniref:Uncharacterized protein n=1 Tax=Steinernema carpocapsae TaxID=34508 RepID=A0A4U5P7S4_STECR|nr:hypothetical protein L596_006990 [Steinernema carpocapsae]
MAQVPQSDEPGHLFNHPPRNHKPRIAEVRTHPGVRVSVPSWVTKLTGFAGTLYSHETSEIHPGKQEMNLHTREYELREFSSRRREDELYASPPG